MKFLGTVEAKSRVIYEVTVKRARRKKTDFLDYQSCVETLAKKSRIAETRPGHESFEPNATRTVKKFFRSLRSPQTSGYLRVELRSTHRHPVDGHPLVVANDQVTSFGQTIVVEGEGMPGNFERGDALAKINVVFPKKLTENQKKLIAELFD